MSQIMSEYAAISGTISVEERQHLWLLIGSVAVKRWRPVDAHEHAAANHAAIVVGAPLCRPAGLPRRQAGAQGRPPAGIIPCCRLLRPCAATSYA